MKIKNLRQKERAESNMSEKWDFKATIEENLIDEEKHAMRARILHILDGFKEEHEYMFVKGRDHDEWTQLGEDLFNGLGLGV